MGEICGPAAAVRQRSTFYCIDLAFKKQVYFCKPGLHNRLLEIPSLAPHSGANGIDLIEHFSGLACEPDFHDPFG
jgi:hypothetical protein